jgi:hypothetical protein
MQRKGTKETESVQRTQGKVRKVKKRKGGKSSQVRSRGTLTNLLNGFYRVDWKI